jgi:hypothetical protein
MAWFAGRFQGQAGQDTKVGLEDWRLEYQPRGRGEVAGRIALGSLGRVR